MTIATALQQEGMLEAPNFSNSLKHYSLKSNIVLFKSSSSERNAESKETSDDNFPFSHSGNDEEKLYTDSCRLKVCGCKKYDDSKIECFDWVKNCRSDLENSLKINETCGKAGKIVINLGSSSDSGVEVFNDLMFTRINGKSNYELALANQNDLKTNKCSLFSIEELIKKS